MGYLTVSARTCRRSAFLAVLLLGLSACSGTPESRKLRFAESGDRYFGQGKYVEAAIEYRNAIQIDARFGPARKRLAECYEKTSQPTQALEEYVRAADLLPTDLDLQLTAARYLILARRFEDAKVRAETVLAKDERNVVAHVLLGNALVGLQNIDEAINTIQEAIELDPMRGATYAELGVIEMSRGRRDAAEAAFKRTIELDPKWVPGYLALANHYWAARQLPDAERMLRTALSLDAANPAANRAMGLFLVAAKRSPEAEPYAKTLATTGADPFALADYYLFTSRPADAIRQLEPLKNQPRLAGGATRRLAQAHAQRGNLGDAHRVVDELLAKDDKAADPLLLKGRLLAVEGKTDQAVTTFEAAVRSDPNSAASHYALGRAHAARGDVESARNAYSEVLRLNPRAVSAQVQLANLDLVDGRAKSSVERARGAVRSEPSNLAAQVTLIRGLIATGDLTGAERALAPLLAAQRPLAIAHTLRGRLSLAAKDPAGARRSFDRALTLAPDDVETIEHLVALDIAEGNAAAARTRIDAAIQRQPDRAPLRLVAARTAVAIKDPAAAESHLRHAVTADPAFQPAFVMLAQMYVAQGKLATAKQDLEALAARQARPVAALTMLGLISQIERDATAAEKYFERVLTFDPRAPIAANNLAWSYAERGVQLDRALELATTGVETEARRPELHDTLGWVYYKKAMPDRAIAAFRESIRLAPKNPIYHYHLGLAQVQAGDIEGGHRSLKTALEMGPFEGASEARRLLGEVRAAASTTR